MYITFLCCIIVIIIMSASMFSMMHTCIVPGLMWCADVYTSCIVWKLISLSYNNNIRFFRWQWVEEDQLAHTELAAFSLKHGSATCCHSMQCNEPHHLTSINVRASANDWLGFTRTPMCTFLPPPIPPPHPTPPCSPLLRWLVGKDHFYARIVQQWRTNTGWATVFCGRKPSVS